GDQSFVLVGFAEILLPESVTSYRGYVARFTFDTGTFPKWNIKLLPESGLSCIKILPDGQILAMGWHSTMDSIHYMDHDLIRATKIDTTGFVIWDKTYDYKFNAPTAHFIVGPRAFELTSDGG